MSHDTKLGYWTEYRWYNYQLLPLFLNSHCCCKKASNEKLTEEYHKTIFNATTDWGNSC